ncbi:MAG: hypothetical protein OER56_04385 [Hyphomicrobiales bacterium]|nr:hypothetical protein [Hyphomicrobiales bacterium]
MKNRFKLSRLAAGALVLWLASTSASAGEKHTFAVAGVALGMDYERVRTIYPASEVEEQAANCYRYGSAVRDPSMTRRVLRHRGYAGVLTMTFASPRRGGRLLRIHYDRRVDPSGFEARQLLDGLTTQYGAYDRILHRRKMEPAGRIIGFEWLKPGGASLRVILRNDHHAGPDALHLSFLARSAVRKPQSGRHPVQCASDH